MRTLCGTILAAVVACSAFAGNEANPDAVELAPLPMPVEFKSNIDSPVVFDSTATVVVDCPDEEAVKWLVAHFAEWYGDQAPKVVAGTTNLGLIDGGLGTRRPAVRDEAYAITADASGVKVAARSLAGVRWAAYTLRQLAIAKRKAGLSPNEPGCTLERFEVVRHY